MSIWLRQSVQQREWDGRQMSHFLTIFFPVWEQSCIRQSRHQQGEHPVEQWKQFRQRGGRHGQQRGLTGRPGWPRWAHPQTQEVETQPDSGAAHWQPGHPRGESSCLFSSSLFYLNHLSPSWQCLSYSSLLLCVCFFVLLISFFVVLVRLFFHYDSSVLGQ